MIQRSVTTEGEAAKSPRGLWVRTGIARELPSHQLQFTPTKEMKINRITKLAFKEKQ